MRKLFYCNNSEQPEALVAMVTCTAWILKMYNPTGISEKQSVNCLEKLSNTCKIAGAMYLYRSRKTETELSLSWLYQAETVETLTNMQTAQSGAKCSISWQQYLRLDTALNCYN